MEASRAALAAAEAKALETKCVIAGLPKLRERVAARALKPERWTPLMRFSPSHSSRRRSGLRVTEIEPLNNGADRALKFRFALTARFRKSGAFSNR